ncbi:hypothetical protein ABEF95_000999 [Exophiala dermatitidis]
MASKTRIPAATAPLMFITTDSRCRLAQEAIKVHILRRRHRKGDKGRCRYNDCESGGQVHVWESVPSSAPSNSPKPTKTEMPKTDNEASNWNSTLTVIDDEQLNYLNNLGKVLGARGPCEPLQDPVDHLIRKFIHRCRRSRAAEEFLSCYRLCSAAFSAFLANETLVSTYERGTASSLSAVELEQYALQQVSQQISVSPSEPEYGTILAAALLANHKELKEEHAFADWHWNALKRMISLRGGVYCLRAHEELHALLFWLDILVCNAFHCSLGQLSSVQSSEAPFRDKDEFVELFDRIAEQCSCPTENHFGNMVLIRTLRALHQPTFMRDKCAQIKWRRAKLACSIHLTALLLQDQAESDSCARTALIKIEEEVVLRENTCQVLPEELLHIILRATNQDGLCESIWYTSRIMNVIKQLPLDTRNTCDDILSAFLGHGDLTIESALERWRGVSTALVQGEPQYCDKGSLVDEEFQQIDQMG